MMERLVAENPITYDEALRLYNELMDFMSRHKIEVIYDNQGLVGLKNNLDYYKFISKEVGYNG